MDTRDKIVTPEALPALGLNAPAVATGYFDVLGPEHVAELEALAGAGPLVVVVLPLDGELLAERTRAELVAALRAVDYVVAAKDPDPSGLLDLLRPSRVARLETADLRRRHELIEDVRRRHHA
jgi:bifunctional ADP-heptose synthase (sugar kinase/adenylyltransferase)